MATKPQLHELSLPPDAIEKGGHEVLRAVVVDRGLSVSLQRAFDEPETWGLLLADVARHIARIYALETDLTEEDVLDRIKSLLDAEWDQTRDPGATNAVN